MLKQILLGLTLVLSQFVSQAQFDFSGQVSPEFVEGEVYLSIIDDYRKLHGVYNDQTLYHQSPDSLGFFNFTGDNLPNENRIYRLHADTCPSGELALNHFSGHCENSREILFIANSKSQIDFPISNEQSFCKTETSQMAADGLLKVDSLFSEMKFSFASLNTTASHSMNLEKWYGELISFGKGLKEPLAEIYIYAFVSERGGMFYEHYMKDVNNNGYFQDLLERMETIYPNAPYTLQLKDELTADRYLADQHDKTPVWFYWVIAILAISMLANFFIIGRWLKHKKGGPIEASLSQQELKIKELILEGKSNKEIASELFISVSTVKTHINNLYKKLGVSSRDELKNL